MRRAYPNPVQIPRHRRRPPAWLRTLAWTALFVGLSVVILAFTAYAG